MQRSRFGEAALKSGYLNPEQLDLLERIQARDLHDGRVPRPLPILSIQEGFLTFHQVSEILEKAEQKRRGATGPVATSRTSSSVVTRLRRRLVTVS